MWKNLSVAAAAALVMGFVGASCGGGSKNVCEDRNVQCTAPLLCDPEDGVCKCGGRGGVECGTGEACDATANVCVSTRCASVDCQDKPGTSCDVNDGQCKCGGTGGTVCGEGQICNPLSVHCEVSVDCSTRSCPLNQTCDTGTGQCSCGGQSCTAGQTCSVGEDGSKRCVDSACTGVACVGANACDSADGLCKCNGVVCVNGQTCGCPPGADAGCADDARVCRASNLCANKTCGGGTTCDPADGSCKCGGPGGPSCGANQLCNLGPPAHCEGGQQCSLPDGGAKVCGNGTSCDPEDGQCKCGGRGGAVCAGAVDGGAPAEICVTNTNQQACRRPCDVRAASAGCATGTYCYFDSTALTPASYCSAPTGGNREDDACTAPTNCFFAPDGGEFGSPHPLHCLNLAVGQPGICHAYCDTAAGMAGCSQDRPRTCLAIPDAPTGTGYCNAQTP